MVVDVLALNLALLAGNVYLLLRARSHLQQMRRAAHDFTRRLMSGQVAVVDANTGNAGRLRVVPAGDDTLLLYIEPLDQPPAIH